MGPPRRRNISCSSRGVNRAALSETPLFKACFTLYDPYPRHGAGAWLSK